MSDIFLFRLVTRGCIPFIVCVEMTAGQGLGLGMGIRKMLKEEVYDIDIPPNEGEKKTLLLAPLGRHVVETWAARLQLFVSYPLELDSAIYSFS